MCVLGLGSGDEAGGAWDSLFLIDYLLFGIGDMRPRIGVGAVLREHKLRRWGRFGWRAVESFEEGRFCILRDIFMANTVQKDRGFFAERLFTKTGTWLLIRRSRLVGS